MCKKILIVEDNQMNRILVQDLLENKNYKVLTAENANEALEKTNSFAPDLILMDINLPEKNGIEVTKQIKNIESIEDIPIVALTAHATNKEKKEIKKSGKFAEYITKPIDTRKFPDQIEQILQVGNYGKK